jgi:hypothetical protein
VRLPKSAIIHPKNHLDPYLRSLLVGDLNGCFRIWKYDSYKAAVFRKFSKLQALQHNPLQTLRNFQNKTLGFCKKEKKRTGRCGLCLRFEELETKVEKKGFTGLTGQEKIDYVLILRHKVFFIHSYLAFVCFSEKYW